MATAPSYNPDKPKKPEAFPATHPGIHWSMRLMSLVSLLALSMYTYVLILCQRGGAKKGASLAAHEHARRVKLSTAAFSLDLAVSAYFSAATPAILEKGGVHFDRKDLPRPLFWFFAITGFVPTASMCLTVLGGWKWSNLIKQNANLRRLHKAIAWVAYLSWWVACSPLFLVGILGETRTIELLKRLMATSPDSKK